MNSGVRASEEDAGVWRGHRQARREYVSMPAEATTLSSRPG